MLKAAAALPHTFPGLVVVAACFTNTLSAMENYPPPTPCLFTLCEGARRVDSRSGGNADDDHDCPPIFTTAHQLLNYHFYLAFPILIAK